MASQVKYYQEVQIVHEATKKFLCVESVENNEIAHFYDKDFMDTDIYKLSNSYYMSDETHFKLLPACNF